MIKKMVRKIKLFDPIIGKDEEKSVTKVLKSKFWASGAGTGNVKKFEQKFKQFVKADECIAVNSGTAALNLALSLIDIKNSEVILPSLSFVSTANAIIINGGKPVFVDVNEKTLNIDPEKIQNAITKKTKVIIPVHFGGLSCDLKKINSLGKKYNLKIIEDAAHAAGTVYNNKNIGSNGFAVCFSFHPAKNLAMPTGGLIAINHKQHKISTELLKAKRWCGITDRINSDYEVKEIGNNYYMNEFSASLGLVQLNKLRKLNKIRKKIAKRYSEEIQLNKKMPYDKNCSYHLYWILVKNRNELRKILSDSGIETGTHYKPIHSFKYYKSKISLPITETIGKKIITIPIHPNLKNYEINRIINLVNKFAE
jgi:dTDP-4-amino-4,6-dideoxygalactose transaminase